MAPHPKSAEVAHVTRLAGGLDMPEKKSPEAQRLTEQWFVLLSSREATRGPNGADLYKPWKVVGAFTNADDALDFARTKVARIGVLVRVAQAHVDIRARVDFEVVRPGMTP